MESLMDEDLDFEDYEVAVSEEKKTKSETDGADLKALYAIGKGENIFVKLEVFGEINPELSYYIGLTPPGEEDDMVVYQIFLGGYRKGSEGKINFWSQVVSTDKPKEEDPKGIEVEAKEDSLIIRIPKSSVGFPESQGFFTLSEINAGVMVEEKLDDTQFTED